MHAGDPFPDFSGPTFEGHRVRSRDYHGQDNIVCYFYPADFTPGSMREAIDFEHRLPDFAAVHTVVVGISVDPLATHQAFSEAFGLHFPLVSDEGRTLAQQLGILIDLPSRPDLGPVARRTTFVLDKQGTIRHIFSVTAVEGHVDQVLDRVRQMEP